MAPTSRHHHHVLFAQLHLLCSPLMSFTALFASDGPSGLSPRLAHLVNVCQVENTSGRPCPARDPPSLRSWYRVRSTSKSPVHRLYEYNSSSGPPGSLHLLRHFNSPPIGRPGRRDFARSRSMKCKIARDSPVQSSDPPAPGRRSDRLMADTPLILVKGTTTMTPQWLAIKPPNLLPHTGANRHNI